MLEKMDSLVARASGTPEQAVKSACSDAEPRRLSKEEAEHILREAERTQERWGRDIPDETGPAPSLDVLVEKEIDGRDIPAGQREKLLTVARSRQDQHDAQRRDAGLKKLADSVGSRFAGASLDSFKATTPEQKKVLATIREYGENIKEQVANGDGVILFGSAGSGKTHLLVALTKTAIEAGLTIEWVNGQDLFARFRAAIDGGESESQIIKVMVKPDVLVLDDLLPPGGALSDYQSSMVYRIVDSRYRNCKPTWATMNVADGTEAERGMGAQVVDRLRHGATTLFCNWPSYRRAAI